MKPFMCEDFLLNSATARRLYHDYAAQQPIYDYHCHLNPKDIAENRRFANLGQIWLEGDHYKWRALRTAGVPEALITGKQSSDYEKYQAWARVVPLTLGNPLYHWTHLELRRPFGIANRLLNPETADAIWAECNEKLATEAFSARGIMRQMNVRMVGTTDDPIDSLIYHRQIAEDSSFDIDVSPSWRPDRAIKIELDGFEAYLQKLEVAANVNIANFDDLRTALRHRLDHFAAHGCRIADHGIEVMRFSPLLNDSELTQLLIRRRKGEQLTETEAGQFSSALMVWLGNEYAKRGWVMQLHIGAQRNNNLRMFKALGADSGFDSIGDHPVAQPLAQLLGTIDLLPEGLPKTILYCLNPRDNEVLATMAGNFQGGGIAGKIQFGSGWWFNDQKDGMLRQLEQCSQMGLLSQFVGMLTDSRSFLSYTRHEYFRRLLCDLLGRWAENGEIPADTQWLGSMVADICYHNAERYFQPSAAVNGSLQKVSKKP